MSATLRLFRPLASVSRPAIKPSYRASISPRLFHSTPAAMTIHNIRSLKEFQDTINDKEKPNVLIDCFAEWCGPCKQIAPFMAKLSQEAEFKDVYFAKFDVDELPELSQALGVSAMPTFFFFKDGEKVGDMLGANPGGLVQLIKKNM